MASAVGLRVLLCAGLLGAAHGQMSMGPEEEEMLEAMGIKGQPMGRKNTKPQAELLKSEEQRRRMAEMRAYLDRQIKDKASTKAAARLEARHANSLPAGRVSALPTGSDIDAEEEAYVKMALKHALDGQVERKEVFAKKEREAEVRQEQQALSHVAREMQEARFRSWSERKQQEEALRATWAKQQQLKLMETTLDKAEAA